MDDHTLIHYNTYSKVLLGYEQKQGQRLGHQSFVSSTLLPTLPAFLRLIPVYLCASFAVCDSYLIKLVNCFAKRCGATFMWTQVQGFDIIQGDAYLSRTYLEWAYVCNAGKPNHRGPRTLSKGGGNIQAA